MGVMSVRVFSDLHYRDPSSGVRQLAALKPLFAEADEIVLNGDTLDTRLPAAGETLAELRGFFGRVGPAVRFLSGNHDPDISEEAELLLGDGRVWVTHGDVLFDDIVPWSEHRAEFVRRLGVLEAGLAPEERARVETRLRRHREVCAGFHGEARHVRDHIVARTRRVVATLFPPTRVMAILDSWRGTPRLAAALAREQRAAARVVVLGHTHYPGVWRVPGPAGEPGVTVINTGSYTRPWGACFVELCGERVRVVRIVKVGREFRPGRVVAELGLGDR